MARTPRSVVAVLVKLETADGLMVFDSARVQVGCTYRVSPATRRTMGFYNVEQRRSHTKEMVREVTSSRWLPVECLEFTAGAVQ
jgi:hypothetical protein